MSETWVVILLYPKNPNFSVNILTDFIKPTVEELEKKNLLNTFHFFFEPELHFRVRPADQKQVSQIKAVIKTNLKTVQKFIKKSDFSQYSGEEKDFGIEGWKITQKYFEYCCRISLLYFEVARGIKAPPSPQYIGNQFNVGKLVHCFLNQLGFDASMEADFHGNRSVERRLMSLGVFQRLNELESKLVRLDGIESRLSKLENSQRKSATSKPRAKVSKKTQMKVDKAVDYV